MIKRDIPFNQVKRTEMERGNYLQPATDISTVALCPECQWMRTNYIVKDFKKGVSLKRGAPRKRAGVFLYNPAENKVLVVQVFNEFTGIPKGGQEDGETTVQTALRELEEEAGIKLPCLDEENKVVFDRTCTYYIVETDTCLPTKLHKFDGNDVTGVGWVHPKCLCKIPGRTTSHLDRMIRRIQGNAIESAK